MERLNHMAKYHFQEQGEVQREGESPLEDKNVKKKKLSDFVFSESMLDEFLY